MKYFLSALLLLSGLNLMLARSIFWGPYHTDLVNPWSSYDYNDELFPILSRENSHKEKEFENIYKIYDKSSEDSKEHMKDVSKTSNELKEDDDDDYKLKGIENLFNTFLGFDSKEDETKSKENTKENENNTNENYDDDDDDTENSSKHVPVKDKDSSEERKSLDKSESKESNELLAVNTKDENVVNRENLFQDLGNIKFLEDTLKEQDISRLIAVAWTVSTIDDLMKLSEHTSESDELLTEEEVQEKQFKEINNYMKVFGSLWHKIFADYVDEDSSLNKNDEMDNENQSNKAKDDDDDDTDDKDSKETANDDEESSQSLEFHDLENSQKNLKNHRYDTHHHNSIATKELKPTSAPYLPEIFTSNNDNKNNVIHEYVELRERLDTLQDNLLVNELQLDKDFYDIVANDSEDENVKKLASDIAILRDNVNKIKNNVDNMQDLKTTLYMQQLVKAALKKVNLK